MNFKSLAEPPPPEPEFTVICIDNGQRASYSSGVYHAQVEATKLHCKTVLQCNPKSIVSIVKMSSLDFGYLVRPTSDLEKIMSALQYVPCQGEGETEVQRALGRVLATFSRAPSDMKKRLLMFVGWTISLHLCDARSYGEKLKKSGVALNVFNFFRLKIDAYINQNASVLHGHYHYGRKELERLVFVVNDHGNNHIEDITDKCESSALDTLSKSILEKHLHYLDQKAAADDENNKSVADEKNKSVEAPELEQFHNEKNKSGSDDEYGQAQYGNRLSRKKKKHRRKC